MTAKLPLALSLLKEALLGEISTEHAPSPSSWTDTACPAIVNVPARAASDGFAVRLTFTTPFPVPLEPLVIDIQPLSDAAVHVQWLAAVTFTEPDPPDALNDSDVGERV